MLAMCDKTNMDPLVRVDLVWALSYITDGCCGGNENGGTANFALTRGAIPHLVKLIKDFPDERGLMIATLRTMGNFVAGTNEQADVVLEAGFLEHALMFLDHPSVSFTILFSHASCSCSLVNSNSCLYSLL